MTLPALRIENLSVGLRGSDGTHHALTSGTSLSLMPARTTAIVGESGCGKSITALAVLNLLRHPLGILGGRILLALDDGEVDIAALSPTADRMRDLRGRHVSMIFQDPLTALDPVYTIGNQIGESLRRHFGMSRRDAFDRSVELLRLVGIPSPEKRVRDYPFRLSGGMRQRAMIAMAIACEPRVLVADEPTTALDVTVQAQILDLLRELRDRLGMATLFITHDLGVVAEMAEDVVVMYRGKVVERASAVQLFAAPAHPYTRGLLASLPPLDGRRDRLTPIPGQVRPPDASEPGCPFADRCGFAMPICRDAPPPVVRLEEGHEAACVLLVREGANAP